MRFHRARSVVLTEDELVEIRAAQRTFEGILSDKFGPIVKIFMQLSLIWAWEGAYIRTALGQFSFGKSRLQIKNSAI